MKRLMSKVKKSKEDDDHGAPAAGAGKAMVPPQGDSPEAIVVREVIAFCESAAPNSSTAGEEYLHLPAIVDGAESSPAAATGAATTIRRYLAKDQYGRGFAQYNAIMLMRILTDNPGRHFTQNLDKEFVSTVKRLLRDSTDQGVQQILRETLDYFEVEKSPNNTTLGPLMEMWRREKGLGAQLYQRSGRTNGVLASGGGGRRSRGLPPPDELAARIEEAKTTARLLLQTMQSTPTAELASNDLVKEFAARARAAQKSVHGYMHAENPGPDDDTMMTLIETNEQLNIAMSKHHRAVLAAKKQNGQSPSPQPQPGTDNNLGAGTGYGQLSQQPRTNGFNQNTDTSTFMPPPGPPPPKTTGDAPDNPFTDAAEFEHEQEQEQQKPKSSFSLFGKSKKSTEPSSEAAYKPYTGAPTTVSSEGATEPSRPAALGFGQGSTQSYLNRQESAANNITMHGASPPQQPVDK